MKGPLRWSPALPDAFQLKSFNAKISGVFHALDPHVSFMLTCFFPPFFSVIFFFNVIFFYEFKLIIGVITVLFFFKVVLIRQYS